MIIVKVSIKNVHAIAVLALLIAVLGAVAILLIPVDILPAFKAPAVQVMTYYQGMPTASVEKTISNRIERWTDQAPGCERIESKSTLGVSIVLVFVYFGVLQAFGKMGEVALLPPVMAAWAPNLLFSGAGLYLTATARW